MITAEESDANMYSNGIIYFGTIFIMLIIIYEDIISNKHRKVIHNKTCKNFLYHTDFFQRLNFPIIPWFDLTRITYFNLLDSNERYCYMIHNPCRLNY